MSANICAVLSATEKKDRKKLREQSTVPQVIGGDAME